MSTGSLNFPPQDSPHVASQGVIPRRFVGREAWLEALQPWLHQLRETDRRGLLLLNDSLCVSLSWGLASLLNGRPMMLEGFLLWTLLTMGALYASDQYSLVPHDERAIGKGLIFASLFTMAIAWAVAQLAFLPVILLAAGLGFLLLAASRRLWTWMFACRATRRRTLLLCNGPEALEVLDEIRRHPLSGIRALGLVGEKDQAPDVPLSHLGEPNHLPKLAQAWRANSILAGPSAFQKDGWQRKLSLGEETLDIPGLFERLSYRIPVRQVDERWFVEHFTWKRGLGYRLAKRAMDVLFAAFGILVTLPFLPLVAIANRFDDRGPLFYSQERIGHFGKPFRVYKLRTMRVDAEKHGAVWAQKNDPRVTRLGHFLRLTRLDELP